MVVSHCWLIERYHCALEKRLRDGELQTETADRSGASLSHLPHCSLATAVADL